MEPKKREESVAPGRSGVESERGEPVLLLLRLDKYKSELCPAPSGECESKVCTFYHAEKDYRRPLQDFRYMKEHCPRGCAHPVTAHPRNVVEQKYHTQNYKRKYCRDFLLGGACLYQECCSAAHSDLELLIRPLHLYPIDRDFLFFRFKTEICPFSWSNHNAFTCVYAHNWQDFKRPFFPALRPERCEFWKVNKRIGEYAEGCPRGLACEFCHGWKECEFHPVNFKQTECKKCSPPSDAEPLARFGDPDEPPEINHVVINRHICSFRHEWEEPDSNPLTFDHFFLFPRRAPQGPRSMSAFLLETLGLHVQGLEGNAPLTRLEVVDFLRIKHGPSGPSQVSRSKPSIQTMPTTTHGPSSKILPRFEALSGVGSLPDSNARQSLFTATLSGSAKGQSFSNLPAPLPPSSLSLLSLTHHPVPGPRPKQRFPAPASHRDVLGASARLGRTFERSYTDKDSPPHAPSRKEDDF